MTGRECLFAARAGDDALWRIHAAAAEAERMLDAGKGWDEISELINFEGNSAAVHARLKMVMLQNTDVVTEARQIFDEEALR